ncbi:WxcM-like domain-containing protein [Olleya sp. HaHaR_3_96]|uniref:WxcM-like domain-containing protein n=1 Tax=Olleya sp. HaHaR_3_96 TaxID=2745560 RepID=UPI001C4FFE91|nr:WxcM-like domain-containing protein [Olleya sp. HaHaR_3_96]QXP60671.1 WxcM-like domain-containing protein [Olleya sp. HaHaR_3_96]
MILKTPELIDGDIFSDARGTLQFVNDFNLSSIKRVYFIIHPKTETIRAWQGHKIESRWFYCVKGSFSIKLVKIDDWDNPSDNCKIFEFDLEENTPQVLFIPNGYANGFSALEKNSKLMIMSDYTLNEVQDDNYRFESTKWVNWKK